jgi:xanthine dehydrogenase YagR molybdenum-binding subunit
LEERVVDTALGLQLNPCLEDYKLPHSLEIPKMTVILDDEDTRGVIGVSEAPIVPGGAAIANAIHNACGARIRSLPCTPDKVLIALGKVS